MPEKHLTWGNLADFYHRKTRGIARIKPMQEIYNWATKQEEITETPDGLILKPTPRPIRNRVYNPRSGYKYIIPFGKHKGETIKQVLESDPGYIVWLDSLGKGLVMMPRPRRDIVILAEEAEQENSRDELSWFNPDDLFD